MEPDVGWTVRVEFETEGVTEDVAGELCDRLGQPVSIDVRQGRIATYTNVFSDVSVSVAVEAALEQIGLIGTVVSVEAMTFAEQDRQLATPQN